MSVCEVLGGGGGGELRLEIEGIVHVVCIFTVFLV